MKCILGMCILAAQLTHVDVASKNPLITTAASYDGISRDVSKFYKPEDRTFSMGGDLYTENTKISLYYNNGIDTPKYDKEDMLAVQVTRHIPINKQLSVNITGGYTFGGNESHTSCKDSYNREYYCGNLTAWSDFDAPENKQLWNTGISINYKF